MRTRGTQVLELLPDDTKSLYRRALANWRLGEIEKAAADLERILEICVDDYAGGAETTTAKKAARKLLKQIEESEERAEMVETKMDPVTCLRTFQRGSLT